MSLAKYVLNPKQLLKLVSYCLTNQGVSDADQERIIAGLFPTDSETAALCLSLMGFEVNVGEVTEWAANPDNEVEYVDGERRWTLNNIGIMGLALLDGGHLNAVALFRKAIDRGAADDMAETAALLANMLAARSNYVARN